jgi:DNA-binding NtrC family response regulator
MSKLVETTVGHDAATRRVNIEKFEFVFSFRRRRNELTLNGLVVSSDDQVRRKLAEILGQCGLAPVLASTVNESGMALAGHEVFIVLCDDLVDGRYEDIVKLAGRFNTKLPVIVLSRTGDWPEYLTAIRSGAFDYVPYPPIPQDLHWIIRNALSGHKRQWHVEGD